MSIYQNILVAVDLHPSCDKPVLGHALEIAKQQGAKLTIVHAVEHINAYGMAQAYPTVIDIEEQMLVDAKKAMEALCKKYGLAAKDQVIEVGSPKVMILEHATQMKADLLVVGSHGRHGISALLGSTANAVLHHARCDVLAVWLKEG